MLSIYVVDPLSVERDLKRGRDRQEEGYCGDAWYRSKRFCCPPVDETSQYTPYHNFLSYTLADEESCSAWKTWNSVFGPMVDGSEWVAFESNMVEYIAWTIIAVSQLFT